MNPSFEPTPQPSSTSGSEQDFAKLQAQAAMAEVTRRMKNGANNFYWIAALSVINSLVLQFGGNSFFVVGLAGTLFTDFIFIEMASGFPDAALIIKIIGIGVSILLSGIVALFGLFANRGKRWAFIVGMIIYAVDALLMLLFQEWMGVLFHIFFLYGLFMGLRALNELDKLKAQENKPTGFLQNFGNP